MMHWAERDELDQAVCLAVLRGHHYVSKIARYLGVEPDRIEDALAGMLGEGLLRSGERILFH